MFLSLFAISLVLFFISNLFRRRKTGKLPPGTLGWFPFLGDTLSFVAPHFSTSKGQFLEYNIKRYGNIFRSHLFGHPTIVSCDAEFNSFVLQNEDRLFVSSYPINIPGILGDLTLLVTTGEHHKRLRAVALNLFATVKTHNNSFLSDIEDNALFILGSWMNKTTLHFCAEARKFTFYMIAKQIVSLTPDDPETVHLLTNFQTFMKGLASLPIKLPRTSYSKAILAKERIMAITRKILQERQKGRYGERRIDFLDVLLMHKELTEGEILSLVLDLLLGGYETTAMLNSVIVRFLADDSKSLLELREEHLRLRRNKESGERLGWDDYTDMPFTHSLINEGLRLGNIVKFVHRKATQTIQYKGYEIPEGWKVLPIFSGVHLDSSLYLDPLKFNPWRWQAIEIPGNKHFMPFGGGRRLCPGSELAKVETAFFLHHLVLNFEWTALIPSERPMAFPYVEFKHGLQLSVHPLPPSTATTLVNTC